MSKGKVAIMWIGEVPTGWYLERHQCIADKGDYFRWKFYVRGQAS
jgi:hypothetical protein